MSSWLVILVIILLSALLGDQVVLNFVSWPERLGLNLIFATATAGEVGIGWLAFLLAEFGLLLLAANLTARELVKINDDLPLRSVLIFNDQALLGRGDFWGTSFKFLFGYDVFTLYDLDALDDG